MKRNGFSKRIISYLLVLVCALVVNFLIPRMMPGSPIDLIAGGTKVTPEVRNAMITRFGLDKPLPEQFFLYIFNAFRGDLGISFQHYPTPVLSLIASSLPWTLLINIPALVLQVSIGYWLGVTAAWHAGKKRDAILQNTALTLQSTPMFWLAMMLVFLFGVGLKVLPISGAYTPSARPIPAWDRLADIAKHAVMPIMTQVLAQSGVFQLIIRNTMVGVIKEQYVMVAKAKGLPEKVVRHRHAARNALLPMVTFVGLSLSASFGGSIFTETVFAYPGIGKLVYQSALNRDYPLLQGCFLIFSLLIILVNLLVDVTYRFLDPRIRK